MNMNFNFNNPTNLLFGREKLSELGKQINAKRSAGKLGKKALLLISNGKSAKVSGAYDRVLEQLRQADVEVAVCGGIMENPLKSAVMDGAAFAKENGCDFIAAQAIDEALEELDIEYIDLMLLHHPSNNDVQAYKALEQAVADGKIRSIGLSNYYIKELGEFLPKVTIPPAVVQNEIHPYYQDIDVVPFIQSHGIVVEGWFPFGGRGHTSELFNDSVIKGIAQAHQVSSAQVILRWNLQRGVVVIPGSGNPEHVKENLELFSFELTEAEMEQIKTLNRNEKHEWY